MLYLKRRHDAQIMWPYAYYVTLGSLQNGQLELQRRNRPFAQETHKDTAVSVWFWQDFERVPEYRVSFEA